MYDDLAGLGGTIQSSMDLSGMASLVESIQSTIRAVRDFGPIGGYQSSKALWMAYGGSHKEAYSSSKDLLSLQMNVLKRLASGTGGGGSISGGAAPIINFNFGDIKVGDVGEVDAAIAKEIKYGRSRILQELQALGLS